MSVSIKVLQNQLSVYSLMLLCCIIFLAGCSSDKKEFTVIKEVKLGPIDTKLAEKGQEIFNLKCTACHKYNERFVGPAIGEVVKRRTPEYIMSMILHPEEMIANNDTTKALLAKFMTPMANQNLTEDEARAVLEHLRVKGQ